MAFGRFTFFAAALPLTVLALLTGTAGACETGGDHGGGGSRQVTFNKPGNINKNININKSVTINKTINASKNITINKSIVINKSGGSAEAFSSAMAAASASAGSGASANIIVYGGNYYEDVTVNNRLGGQIGDIRTTQPCLPQEATVVKAIHAVCVAADGREFPASHMTDKTFLDAGQEGEILRCIPGARLKVTIGDVLQSDQGLAGTYASGKVFQCAPGEALRHYKDGVVKCAPAVPVPDCTERSNLRKYGTSDLFFSYRTKVCAIPASAAQAGREVDLSGMPLEGGVGE
jgi:hypothetical protein